MARGSALVSSTVPPALASRRPAARRWASVRLLLGIVALYPIVLPAQAPAASAALAAWNDSLRAAPTSAALGAVAARAGQGPGVEGLRKALLALRRGELSLDRGQLDQALTVAAWVGNVHRDWAWPRYIAARAALVMDTAGWFPVADAGVTQGEKFEDAFWHSVRETLDRDPGFPGVYQWITPYLVAGGDRLLRPDQLALVRRAVLRTEPAADPDLLLVWGRYLRTERDYDSALAVFGAALAAGGDTARLDLERARTLRALHDSTAAVAAYWDGVAHLTPVGRLFYRFDLAWIVGRDSLAAFDRLPGDSVSWWLHRFWNERATAALMSPFSRLSEQLRRWDVAYARYRARSPWRREAYHSIDIFADNDDCVHQDTKFYEQTWAMEPWLPGDTRFREWLLDQRGVIYLRHGEPIERIGGVDARLGPEDFTDGPGADTPDLTGVWSPWLFPLDRDTPMRRGGTGVIRMEPAWTIEAWVYLIANDFRVIAFRPSRAIGDYDATTMVSYPPFSPRFWLQLSGTLDVWHDAGLRIADRLEHPLGGKVPTIPTCEKPMQAAIARARIDADSTIHNDTDSPPIRSPWQFNSAIFGLGRAVDHTGEAFIVLAVGGDSLHARPAADGGVTYPVHLRLSAWNHQTDSAVTVDTTRVFHARRPLAPGERLMISQALPLGAGDWEIAVLGTGEDRHAGAYTLRRDVRVDRGPGLTLSDLVTGVTGAPSVTAPDGDPFPIDVGGTWTRGSSVELFYEVGGVPVGGSYRSTVEVTPLEPTHGPSLRIATTDRSTLPMNYVRRAVGTDRLVPGTYRLTVTVRAGAEQAVRSTIVILTVPSGSR